MPEQFKQKLARSFFTSKGFLFFLLLATIWVGLISIKAINKRYQMAKDIENIQKEIERLKKNNQELSALINSFNDPNFIEKEAKRRLNLRKEGEEVVILPEAKNSENQTTTYSVNQGKQINNSGSDEQNLVNFAENENQMKDNEEESNFMKWWRYFFQ